MGIFDLFKRKEEKTDLDRYYEERAQAALPHRESCSDGNGRAFTPKPGFRLMVEDVFSITGRGTVITGQVTGDSLMENEVVTLCGRDGSRRPVVIGGIEVFRKMLTEAQPGQNVGILLPGIGRDEIAKGDWLER